MSEVIAIFLDHIGRQSQPDTPGLAFEMIEIRNALFSKPSEFSCLVHGSSILALIRALDK